MAHLHSMGTHLSPAEALGIRKEITSGDSERELKADDTKLDFYVQK